jgi:ribosomal protein S18 acetylase RimI-like enzyme
MRSLEIHKVGRADEGRAVATQVMAFAADPVMRWLYPESDAYLRNFPRFTRAFGGRAFEHGTAYATEGFGGCSLWLPVGVHVDADPVHALCRETLEEPVLSEVLSILDKMDAFHTKEPHWYLTIIGVDPTRQREGIGAALLRHSLAPCDRDGLQAYLESSNPRNVSLYQRHGFEVIGEIQVGSSPPIFPMLRTPR